MLLQKGYGLGVFISDKLKLASKDWALKDAEMFERFSRNLKKTICMKGWILSHQLDDVIDEAIKDINSADYDFLIFMISSHGAESSIEMSDQSSIGIHQKILKRFNQIHPKIVKIFVFDQCCGPNDVKLRNLFHANTNTTNSQQHKAPSNTNNAISNVSHHPDANTIVFKANTRGYVASWNEDGSFLIQAFVSCWSISQFIYDLSLNIRHHMSRNSKSLQCLEYTSTATQKYVIDKYQDNGSNIKIIVKYPENDLKYTMDTFTVNETVSMDTNMNDAFIKHESVDYSDYNGMVCDIKYEISENTLRVNGTVPIKEETVPIKQENGPMDTNMNDVFIKQENNGMQLEQIVANMNVNVLSFAAMNNNDIFQPKVPPLESTKTYTCMRCDYETNRKGNMTRHNKTHGIVEQRMVLQSNKPFKCTYCSKGFSKRCYLQRHITLHTGNKPFKCTVCHRSYTQRSGLKRHNCIKET